MTNPEASASDVIKALLTACQSLYNKPMMTDRSFDKCREIDKAASKAMDGARDFLDLQAPSQPASGEGTARTTDVGKGRELPDGLSQSPDIMSGSICVSGHRFPVSQLLAELASNRKVHDVADDFGIPRERFEAAVFGVAAAFANDGLVEIALAIPASEVETLREECERLKAELIAHGVGVGERGEYCIYCDYSENGKVAHRDNCVLVDVSKSTNELVRANLELNRFRAKLTTARETITQLERQVSIYSDYAIEASDMLMNREFASRLNQIEELRDLHHSMTIKSDAALLDGIVEADQKTIATLQAKLATAESELQKIKQQLAATGGSEPERKPNG